MTLLYYVYIPLGALVFSIFCIILIYNRLVRLRNEVKEGWHQIEVQLKRRYDLVPNLVETVKGYATHEKDSLEAVIQARRQAESARGIKDQLLAENQLSQVLAQLWAVAEQYPELKANQNFLVLQDELASTENRISFARQHYNNCVLNYNTSIQTFPNNLISNFFKFLEASFFEIQLPQERHVPNVKF